MTSHRTMLARLNAGLHAVMASDPKVWFLGEDVLDPYGGAFKVARHLSAAFPDRVLSTPISEAAIVAIATGLALRGFRPVAEIMFGDFLLLAADQIANHAAKYRWMYNDQVRVPMVVRAPMGGRRGYGPTHSQSLEKHFLGIPGVSVVAPHVLDDPGVLLKTAILDVDDPVLVIENKADYGSRLIEAIDGSDILQLDHGPFPTTWVRPQGGLDGVILCYGGMVPLALEAIAALDRREELRLALAVPTQLSPTPVAALEEIVVAIAEAGASKVLTVEESCVAGGWGAEIIASVEEIRDKRGLRSFTYRRLGAAATPIPSSRSQEDCVLPQVHDIISAVLDCF